MSNKRNWNLIVCNKHMMTQECIAIHLSLTKSVVAVELNECITTKSKGCCGLSCMFSYCCSIATTFFVNDGETYAIHITSLKLYIPRLSCICWHTDLC